MSDNPTDAPPLYEDSMNNNGNSTKRSEKNRSSTNEAINASFSNHSNHEPPPNTLYIKPTSVNISQASPQNLHPQYTEYLAREQVRNKNGDYPRDRSQFKHGAPLNPGHTSKGASSSAFPGSLGVTYHNAAGR